LANTRSAIKRIRQNATRRKRNHPVRSRTRTFLKKANVAISTGDSAEAQEAVRAAVSELDRAAQKGVIHRSKAARHKSRLMKKLNSLAA